MTPQREEPEAESDGRGWQSRMPGRAWDEIREVVRKSITEQTWMRGGPSCLDFPVGSVQSHHRVGLEEASYVMLNFCIKALYLHFYS